MEYLLVEFCDKRQVTIDSIDQGFTNEVLEIEAGTHFVSMSPPADFTPEFREIVLRRTTPTNPRVVLFEKV